MTDEERFMLRELFKRIGTIDLMASQVKQLWDRRAILDSLDD